MKHSFSSLYAISALLLVAGCSKECGDLASPTSLSLEVKEFDPGLDRIEGLIEQFQRQRSAFRSHAKDDLGERPLDEAVWMSEADANYMKCDPSVKREERTGVIEFTLPIHVKEDGRAWVNNDDLLAKQEELLDGLTDIRGSGTIYLVNVEVAGSTSESATLEATYLRMSGSGEHGIVEPDPGCWRALVGNVEILLQNDAADVMKWKMRDLHTYPLGTYFVSVSKPQIIGDNTYVWNGLNGYPVYAGTPNTQYDGQGPGWIHSGGNAPTELCFPNYWDRYLTMKGFFAPASSFEPGREIIWEDWSAAYSQLIGGPMDYGSPYYPMGPYHHTWIWKHGIPRLRLGPGQPPE